MPCHLNVMSTDHDPAVKRQWHDDDDNDDDDDDDDDDGSNDDDDDDDDDDDGGGGDDGDGDGNGDDDDDHDHHDDGKQLPFWSFNGHVMRWQVLSCKTWNVPPSQACMQLHKF